MAGTAPSTPVSAGRRALRVTAKSLPEHNRRHNRSLVLQTLFHAGPMSRADLSRESGLTRVTVSDLIGELGEEGLIEDLGPRAGAHVGKPATLIGLNADAYHVVALDLSADDRFVGAVLNLRGEVLARALQPIDDAHGDEAYELVARLVDGLITETERPVLGLGVGTPGIVDAEGVVLEAPNLGWYRRPLGRLLAERFEMPVHVDNDANAAVLAVHTFGRTSGLSLMVVTIEHGVGAGLIIGGALVEGEQLAAGEIGHVVVDEDGETCACGRRGCLEVALATPQLRKRLADADASRRDAILADAGRALGVALSPVISALNLNEVVLSGPAGLIEGPLIETAAQTVRARTMSAVSNGLEMRLADRSEDLVLLGANAFVLAAELGVS